MSKSSEWDQAAKRLILDSVNSSDYQDAELADIAETIAFLEKVFMAEFGWQIAHDGRQTAIKDWLQGLPSACTIPFYNGDILDFAIDYGYLPKDATDAQEQRILDNWFSMMAVKMGQLFDGYRVPSEVTA